MRRIPVLFLVVSLPALLAYCKEMDPADTAKAESASTDDAGADARGALPIPHTDDDVVAYAELCKRELGITGPLPAMSCLAGTEVPITIDGQSINAQNYASLADKG